MKVDGITTGPNSFAGVVGKLLLNCEDRPIVNFQTISSELIDFDSKNLSTDQSYLMKITNFVITGTVVSSLENSSPGKLNHSQ